MRTSGNRGSFLTQNESSSFYCNLSGASRQLQVAPEDSGPKASRQKPIGL